MSTIECEKTQTLSADDWEVFYGGLVSEGITVEDFNRGAVNPFSHLREFVEHRHELTDEQRRFYTDVYRRTIECPDTALPA